MPLNNPRLAVLWWIAFAAELIAAILETVERNYLKAASFYCLALTFLILATGTGTDKPIWRKALLYVLVFASIAMLVYRVVIGKVI